MWFLFQGLIVFAVCASNILYHWTPNSTSLCLAGMGLAWSLTWFISSLMAMPDQNSLAITALVFRAIVGGHDRF